MNKRVEWNQWGPSVIIGILGGFTLFLVNAFLNRFAFHVKIDWLRTLVTALVFAVVFTVVSYQWDKKKP
ncbi:MAG: hypothetical protein ABIF92_03075 [archaeon]